MINTYKGLNASFMLRERFPEGRVARLPKLPPNIRNKFARLEGCPA